MNEEPHWPIKPYWFETVDPLTGRRYTYRRYPSEGMTKQSKETWRAIERLRSYSSYLDTFKEFNKRVDEIIKQSPNGLLF